MLDDCLYAGMEQREASFFGFSRYVGITISVGKLCNTSDVNIHIHLPIFDKFVNLQFLLVKQNVKLL